MQEHDQWSVAGLDIVQFHVAEVRIALANTAEPLSLLLVLRGPALAVRAVMSSAHFVLLRRLTSDADVTCRLWATGAEMPAQIGS